MDGILVIDKPKGITSRDVVNQVGKLLHTKKVGHTGTLDPLATGVLVLCVGKATKLLDLIVAQEKEYIAKVVLGIHTDTLDITGEILDRQEVAVDETQIIDALDSMKGSYMQEVPIYSAVKIDGHKLYEYARKNKKVELPKRMVTISDIEYLNDFNISDGQISFTFRCVVSKGTYIRSLIRDIASKLDTIGVMAELRRTRQGDFSIKQAFSLEQIELGEYSMGSMRAALRSYDTVVADAYLSNKIHHGQILENRYESDTILFVDENDSLLALYQVYDKDHTKVKPWKMF